ncbi:MAG: tetratricopeptide repeat protein, partial [Candidatus Eremiobacterota bacterium]
MEEWTRAEELIREGRLQEAVQEFERALDQGASAPAVYLRRGLAWLEAGHLDEAERDLCRCEPGPRRSRALGQVYSRLGRHSEARAALRECLATHPEDAESWLLVARSELAVGRAFRAVMAATRCIELGSQAGYAVRAEAQAARGRAGPALQDLLQVDNLPVQGRVYQSLGLLGAAERIWDGALVEAPAEAFFQRGEVRFRRGRFQDALEDYLEAQRLGRPAR